MTSKTIDTNNSTNTFGLVTGKVLTVTADSVSNGYVTRTHKARAT